MNPRRWCILAALVWLTLLASAPLALAGDDDAMIASDGIELRGGHNSEFHTHGGPAARIGPLELVVAVSDGAPHTLRVTGLWLLSRHCSETAWSREEALERVAVYWTPDDGSVELEEHAADATLELDRAGRLDVAFVPVEVYQVCDAFAYRVALELDGEARTLEVRLEVTREEPLPRRAP